MKPLVLAVALTLPMVVAACDSSVKAPYDAGVCFLVEQPANGGKPAFHPIADHQGQIEMCAARLEENRVRFLQMGGSRREVVGAYQGRYLFVDRAGVSFAQTLEGNRFMALARTGDGRLAVPGAIPRAPEPPAP